MKSRIKLAVYLTALMTNLSAFADPNDVLQSGGVATGGGHGLGLKIQAQVIEDLENLPKSLLKPEDKKRAIEKANDALFIIVGKPLPPVLFAGKEQSSILDNHPETRVIEVFDLGEEGRLAQPHTIDWTRTEKTLRRSLMVHEVLSLCGIESTGDYHVSAKYWLALNKAPKENKVKTAAKAGNRFAALDSSKSYKRFPNDPCPLHVETDTTTLEIYLTYTRPCLAAGETPIVRCNDLSARNCIMGQSRGDCDIDSLVAVAGDLAGTESQEVWDICREFHESKLTVLPDGNFVVTQTMTIVDWSDRPIAKDKKGHAIPQPFRSKPPLKYQAY